MKLKEQEIYAKNAGRWVETRFMGRPIKICVFNEFDKRKFMDNLSICFGIGGALSEEDRKHILDGVWKELECGNEEPVKMPY